MFEVIYAFVVYTNYLKCLIAYLAFSHNFILVF